MSNLLGRRDEPSAPPSPPVLDGSSAIFTAAAALSDADAAASAAGVVIREASGRQEFIDICSLLADIWGERPAERAQTPVMLRAMSYSGNYVGIALDSSGPVGACIGFFGLAEGWEMHSHIAGVIAPARGRNVGFALKAHQRAWALGRGIETISWTFDPLVRRNAYFNLCKLAARPRAYEPDFYGPMTDGINSGDRTDRLVVEWQLRAAQVQQAAAGSTQEFDPHRCGVDGVTDALGPDERGLPRHSPVQGRFVAVDPPADIERLRAEHPAAALTWRLELRHVLCTLLDDGARVIGFSKQHGYVLDRAA